MGFFYAVRGLRGGPQAESVVVFGYQDGVFRAPGARCLQPLFRIDICRTEHRSCGGSVAPFLIQEGVWAEVDDHPYLHILPRQLLRRGLQIGEILRKGKAGQKCQKYSQKAVQPELGAGKGHEENLKVSRTTPAKAEFRLPLRGGSPFGEQV